MSFYSKTAKNQRFLSDEIDLEAMTFRLLCNPDIVVMCAYTENKINFVSWYKLKANRKIPETPLSLKGGKFDNFKFQSNE